MHIHVSPYSHLCFSFCSVAKFKKKTVSLRRSQDSSQNTQVTSIENLKDKHNAPTLNNNLKEKNNDGVSIKMAAKSHKRPQKDTKVQVLAQNGKTDKARFLASSATSITSRKGHKRKGTLGAQARWPPVLGALFGPGNLTWPAHLAAGLVAMPAQRVCYLSILHYLLFRRL